jgi:hypothetical protein
MINIRQLSSEARKWIEVAQDRNDCVAGHV